METNRNRPTLKFRPNLLDEDPGTGEDCDALFDEDVAAFGKRRPNRDAEWGAKDGWN